MKYQSKSFFLRKHFQMIFKKISGFTIYLYFSQNSKIKWDVLKNVETLFKMEILKVFKNNKLKNLIRIKTESIFNTVIFNFI